MREEPEGFADFWNVWRPMARHTDGRGLARKAFSQHVKDGADPQDIIDGAKCFFRTMKERDRDYVPLSATWLNRGAYEDLAIQERQFQQRIAEAQSRRVEQIKQQAQEPISEHIDAAKRAEMAARARDIIRGTLQ